MADERLSAAQRAALARQAAEESRRAAARHAATRREEQEDRRRQVPSRRPPAVTPKAGLAFRPGVSTTIDPDRVTTRRPPPPAIVPAARVAPAAVEPSPVTAEPQPVTAEPQPVTAEPQPVTAERPASTGEPPATRTSVEPPHPEPEPTPEPEPNGPAEPAPERPPAAADPDASATPASPATDDEPVERLVLPDAPRPAPESAPAPDDQVVTDQVVTDQAMADAAELDPVQLDQSDQSDGDDSAAEPLDQLGPGERMGDYTSQPTTIPPLPGPPVAVIHTAPERSPHDGLVLPDPPRDEDGTPRPPAEAAAAEVPAAAVTVSTMDFDVQAALPAVDEIVAALPDQGDDDAVWSDEPDPTEGVTPAPVVADPAVPPLPEPPALAAGPRPLRSSPPDPATWDILDDVVTVPAPDPVADADDTRELEPVAGAPAAIADSPDAPLEVGEPRATVDGSRPWLRTYPPGIPETYRYPLVPVTRFLDDAAQDFPDVAATAFLGSSISFRQLSEQVDRLAAAMTAAGIRPGDRIGVVLPWTPQLILVLHAAWRGGFDPVVLDPDVGPDALAEAVQTAQPALLIVLDTLYPGLTSHREELESVRYVITTGLLDCLPTLRARMQAVRLKVQAVQIAETEGVRAFTDVLSEAAPTGSQVDLDVESTPAVTLVDGGRVVSLTHAALLAGAFQARLWIPDIRAGREIVGVAGSAADPFTLAAGLGLAMLSASTLLMPEPRPGGVARTIDDGRPTVVVAPVGEVRRVLAPASKRRDLSSVRVTLASGTVHDPAVRTTMEQRTGGRMRTAVSSPAIAGMVVAQPVYAEVRDDAAGLPVTDTDIRIDSPDEEGFGLLMAAGPQVMGDGWGSTGLIGRLDDSGNVVVVGPEGRVARHDGGVSDLEVVGAALRRSDLVIDAILRMEHDGTNSVLVAEVLAADADVSEDRLREVLRTTAPTQAPPGRWTVTVAEPPPPAAESPDVEPAPDAPDGIDGTDDGTPEQPPVVAQDG